MRINLQWLKSLLLNRRDAIMLRWRIKFILAALLFAGSAQAMEVNGDRRVLVMMLNFTNTAQPAYTQATVQARMASADAAITEFSYGQAGLSYTVLNWQRMAIAAPASGCILSTISAEGDRLAAAQGINLGNYDHKVYLLPPYSSSYCTAGEVNKLPGRVWYEGAAPPAALTHIAHELIHNFGSWHAHAWDCGATVLTPPCVSSEIGGYVDIMGSGVAGHPNAAIKESFGWLTATEADVSGDYTIRPLSQAGSAISLILADGRSLYIEYRQATGLDAFLKNVTGSNLLRGLKLTVVETNGQNYMLDMTPTSAQFTPDGALEVGKSWTHGDVTITCVSLNSTQAIVRVRYQ
jgi:hypothetical protein